MVKLVPAEEEPFETERREQMIDPSHPLGHAVVVGILRFERELEDAPRSRGGNPSLVSAEARSVRIRRRAASPSAINRRLMSLFTRADSGARKIVRTKSLSK